MNAIMLILIFIFAIIILLTFYKVGYMDGFSEGQKKLIEKYLKEAENKSEIERVRAKEQLDKYTKFSYKKLNEDLLKIRSDFDVEYNKSLSELSKVNDRITKGNAEIIKLNNLKNEYENDIKNIKENFKDSFIQGRKWLLDLINERYKVKDEIDIQILLDKKRPAVKAAEKLSIIQDERREALIKIKEMEYQIKMYEEYFPFLLDYKNEILNDEIRSFDKGKEFTHDPVNNFLSPEEYSSLTLEQKNQLALDRYIQRSLSNVEIGRMYERYIGYIYEQEGFNVQFLGIEKGFEDLGQDLICSKDNKVIVIQAKCWSSNKVIRERHILQLYATTLLHKLCNENKDVEYESILFTTTILSDLAREVASKLGVKIKEKQTLPKDYPMIKCNINRNGEKIYHLPFDQMYDKVKISAKDGEFYAKTVYEAEKKGFRRAFKWKG